MRIISLLITLILIGLMLMKFNQTKLAHDKTFQEQKIETLQHYDETKEALEEYKKQRAKGMDLLEK